MHQPLDIIAAFRDRIQRHVTDALRAYREELQATANAMAAKGLASSGAHVRARVGVLREHTQALTDKCFSDVTRLPVNPLALRIDFAPFLVTQLNRFFDQAAWDVGIKGLPDSAERAKDGLVKEIHVAMDGDLKDWEAGVWHPRSQPQGVSVTNNNAHFHNSPVQTFQQAGDHSTQTATATLNVQAIQASLEQFVRELEKADLPEAIKDEVMAEVDTIRPQLKKAAPNAMIMREAGTSLRTILENTAAGVLANALWALVAAVGAH
jgi:hypothetical protein